MDRIAGKVYIDEQPDMEECVQNITSDILDKEYTYSRLSRCFVLIFVPIVAVFGIAFNCAFIFVVFRVQFMRNITNIYLVNLAIADTCLLIAAFSQYIGDYLVSPVYDFRFSFHTAFGCSFPNFLIYLCYYASLWTVTLVSIERYLAVCHTFYHRLVSSKSRAVRMVVSVWLVAVLFAGVSTPYTTTSICVMSSNDSIDSPPVILTTYPYCEFYCAWCGIALYISDVLLFIIALVITFTMYILILRNLTKSGASQNNEYKIHSQLRVVQTRNTVAKMLIVNGIVFFVCLFPFSIANIDSISNHFGVYLFEVGFIYPVGWAGRVLFLLNSALNPLIYNATNPRYRMAFREAFRRQKKCYTNIYMKNNNSNASQGSHASSHITRC